MKRHNELEHGLNEAENEKCCFHPPSHALVQACRSRLVSTCVGCYGNTKKERNGDCGHANDDAEPQSTSQSGPMVEVHALEDEGGLVSPYRGLYVRESVWNDLTPIERNCWVIRALARNHPNWVFGIREAAAIHGLPHSYALYNVNHPMTVIVGESGTHHTNKCPYLRRVHRAEYRMDTVQVDAVAVTSLAQTAVDFAAEYGFFYGMPVMDACKRRGVSDAELVECVSRLQDGQALAMQVIRFSDARSENGGESQVRVAFRLCGLMDPELQREFYDPETGNLYRVDFLWRLPNGKLIVVELDGMDKYVNPKMTNNKSMRGVVTTEQERAQGLVRAGVTKVVRIKMNEIYNLQQLAQKLMAAGIPQIYQTNYDFPLAIRPSW